MWNLIAGDFLQWESRGNSAALPLKKFFNHFVIYLLKFNTCYFYHTVRTHLCQTRWHRVIAFKVHGPAVPGCVITALLANRPGLSQKKSSAVLQIHHCSSLDEAIPFSCIFVMWHLQLNCVLTFELHVFFFFFPWQKNMPKFNKIPFYLQPHSSSGAKTLKK